MKLEMLEKLCSEMVENDYTMQHITFSWRQTDINILLAVDGDKYVVNYDEPNAKDGVFAYAVFEKDGDHKKIIYWVTAEEATGKAIQTDEKGKTKDITEQLKKFYW